MIKKKKIFIVIVSVLLVLCIIVLYLVLTRTVYWHNQYYEYNHPSKTDAEYLKVWDVRFLHNADSKEIEELGVNIVNDSLKQNGILTEQLQEIVSEHTFSYINPRDFLSENEYEITDEQFEVKETDVLRHRNKAIFLYGCEYHATYKKNGDTYNYDIGYDGMPNRLYLEYIDDKWTVVTAFRP